MAKMIRCRLNGVLLEFESRNGKMALDWLRKDRGLTGTKEGCREGDCGACMVLLGQRPLDPGCGPVEWLPVTSCLLALDELDGRHLVTIEGLAAEGPTPVMRALHEENASQCGFCSPGIVIALTARLIQGGSLNEEALAAALEGNLCRCTGYASIRRAAARIAEEFTDLPEDFSKRLALLAQGGVLPPSLARTMAEAPPEPATGEASGPQEGRMLGGGTDWFVRHPDPEPGITYAFSDLRGPGSIEFQGDTLVFSSAVTVRDFFASPQVRQLAPGIEGYERDIAGPAIRSRATLTGNIANASPVADMTAILLALDARLRLKCAPEDEGRELPLKDFFLGYKKTAATADEFIDALWIPQGKTSRLFSFEKAAKRSRMDIAAVNTALACTVEGEGQACILKTLRISAGGVGPIPLLLTGASEYTQGKRVDATLVRETARLAAENINPISDVRGSATYRRDMLCRQVIAHFLRLFPEKKLEEELF